MRKYSEGVWYACATIVGILIVSTCAQCGEVVIEKVNYRGWRNTYRMSNGLVELYVLTDVGPRIIDFRPVDGENVFYVRESEVGTTGEPEWIFRGGWRLWIAPEKYETTWLPDNSLCSVQRIGANKLLVIGPPQVAAGIQKIIEVKLFANEPRVRILQRIRNISNRTLRYAPWSLSVMRPGGKALIPLDELDPTALAEIRPLNIWSYTEMNDPRYYWGARLIIVDQSKVPPPPAGQKGRRDDESKIGVGTRQGWVAYWNQGTLYIKRFPYDPHAIYPDNGCNVEVYSCYEFIECENLGPLTTFAPGHEIVYPEEWYLFTGVKLGVAEGEVLPVLKRYLAKTKPVR